MKVDLQSALNDANLDAGQINNQRQLGTSIAAISAIAHASGSSSVPINLCLILDHSGSMNGKPLETVKAAAERLMHRLKPGDRISVVAFDHRAKVIVPNQAIDNLESVKKRIQALKADGGTAIDEGIKLGIEELRKGAKDTVSQAFILTDGENEHGSNDRCVKLAVSAADHNFTLNALGFGDHWNQDVMEKIADAAGGTLSYIERPDRAIEVFDEIFTRIQSVTLTNAYLLFKLMPKVRLAELKPIAQVAPETIELPINPEKDGEFSVRLGDLMTERQRVILTNLYIGQLPEGRQAIAQLRVRYDNPATGEKGLLSDPVLVDANVLASYQPNPNEEVQQHILALAKYRQTQIAEQKLQQGDRLGAATMLQTAAKTALQMGDRGAATVLQGSATQLQEGKELSEGDRKKTRIVSKTVLQ
jgi:Ca-activated chloride channel family protein